VVCKLSGWGQGGEEERIEAPRRCLGRNPVTMYRQALGGEFQVLVLDQLRKGQPTALQLEPMAEEWRHLIGME
jgi:hypothetical protein